ncbi:Ctf19p KNAG_0L00390 [Huiozyma naganishii CBS 8797]|uniref:Uncharacterized protein n=1 Tax=Huiozyma naganishii (strain ATCC MYA-139 / BCRC 22969 / CBS 8797 / KCTC 17520 / NBRC 10181 / NCYC 3082 / Yp74L-3) TaxID=1071383 RepID=J7S3J5_HUIN7|nr:hypothetical protein KNAG_0L00390 [Kazachstania naganishii CBS 8797]CCK72662.1 hypothetical protein KNAG_0L00390 [Kazachstania naganishii CBS 8797]
MDFTSDISGGVSSPRAVGGPGIQLHPKGSGSDGSDSRNSSLLGESDRKRLALMDKREQLLAQRDAMLRDLDTLKQELRRPVAAGPRETASAMPRRQADENAAKMLIDLMLLSRSDSGGPADQTTAESRVRVDGGSGLQEELLLKYDTLPVLNMRLRLKYLTKVLYPYLTLHVVELDAQTVSLECVFKRNAASPLQLLLELQYSSRQEVLRSLRVKHVSPGHHLALQPLLDGCTQNVSVLLFTCNEYNRLVYERDQLRVALRNKFQARLHYDESHLSGSITLRDLRNERALLVEMPIVFDQQYCGFLYPRMQIRLQLTRGQAAVDDVDINGILYRLMEEYGVQDALVDLITYAMLTV